LALAFAAAAPARAQFFQFFDNRPTKRPNTDSWGGRRQDDFWGGRQDGGWGRRQDDDWGWRQADGAPPNLRRKHRPRPRLENPRAVEHNRTKAREPAKTGPGKPEIAKTNAPPATPAVQEGPPPPYEPQLLRLSEIMGALSFLQTICDGPAVAETGGDGKAPWRAQMESLMTAEGAGPSRREKLAGAFNRGLHGYEYSYRACTPNALLAREKFLSEGAQLAHDISTQYRAN
jgi:uncharacterized protein (TIGR02301 family)